MQRRDDATDIDKSIIFCDEFNINNCIKLQREINSIWKPLIIIRSTAAQASARARHNNRYARACVRAWCMLLQCMYSPCYSPSAVGRATHTHIHSDALHCCEIYELIMYAAAAPPPRELHAKYNANMVSLCARTKANVCGRLRCPSYIYIEYYYARVCCDDDAMLRSMINARKIHYEFALRIQYCEFANAHTRLRLRYMGAS